LREVFFFGFSTIYFGGSYLNPDYPSGFSLGNSIGLRLMSCLAGCLLLEVLLDLSVMDLTVLTLMFKQF